MFGPSLPLDVLLQQPDPSSAPAPAFNTHIHLPPNFSAFESVAQAVDLAAAQGLALLGVSNYYDYRVYEQFAELARARQIFPLYGLEVIILDPELAEAGVKANDPGNPGKIYVCGKGITTFRKPPAAAARTIAKIRAGDAARMRQMIGRLRQLCVPHGFAAEIDESAVIELVVRRHGVARETVCLQERHVAQAFQEALFAALPAPERPAALSALCGAVVAAADPVAVQGDLRKHLMKAGKPAFVAEDFITFDEAMEMILAFGGIPAYPVLADGATPICQFEAPVQALIEELRAHNFAAVEFIPIRNSPEVLTAYVTELRDAGFAVLAGTEHNTLDLIAMAPTCLGGAPIPEAVREIFWEGACVAAGHQYAVAGGQAGFVDDQGRPNATYSSDAERLAAFSRLGRAVIAAWQAE